MRQRLWRVFLVAQLHSSEWMGRDTNQDTYTSQYGGCDERELHREAMPTLHGGLRRYGMRLEIFQNGARKFYTDCADCIPDEKTLESMKKAGCRFKLDGKAVAVGKIFGLEGRGCDNPQAARRKTH